MVVVLDEVKKSDLQTWTKEATINGETFSYVRGAKNVSNLIEGRSEMQTKLAEKLGLKDIYFETFQREGATHNDEHPPNYYVLMHGWTANHGLFSEVDNQGTIVEKILQRDPYAVIITPDGNGFGQTNFRDEVLQGDLGSKCTSRAYAEQMDFLISEVLGIGRDKVRIAGHSMGGAAVEEMAATGYPKVIAIAPAIFPTQNAKDYAREAMDKADRSLVDKIDKKLYKIVYGILSQGVAMADKLGKLSKSLEQTAATTVDMMFKLAAPLLLGDTSTVENISTLSQKLSALHTPEFTREKWPIVSKALAQLAVGSDYQDWGEKEWGNFEAAKVSIIAGDTDLLVDQNDLAANLQIMRFCEVSKTGGSGLTLDGLCKSGDSRTSIAGRDESTTVVIGGGHYAPLFSELFIETITS